MSKHTDHTNRMVERLKKKVAYSQKHYNVTLGLSDPKNKDNAILEEVKWKMSGAIRYAEGNGYKIEYKIVSTPKELLKFNCAGCRKRKSGDYFWVVANCKSKGSSDNHGWDNPITKVCSKECGELMILRIV